MSKLLARLTRLEPWRVHFFVHRVADLGRLPGSWVALWRGKKVCHA
jgi:hypothetical protein